jgi:hypothetical protein
MWVEGTAQLKLRNSVFYRNPTGIHVAASSAGGLANADDLSGIDLGADAASDPGKNLLQAPAGLGQNTSVGLCFNIHPSKGETLKAYGNTFMATLSASTAQYDCSKAASAGAQLTMVAGSTCTGGGGVSYSGWGVTGNTLGVGVCAP